MAELSPTDLETYTQGRLSAVDPNTATHLDRALATARNYCRWHVTPVETNVVMTLDGPGKWGGLKVGLGGLYFPSGSYITGVLRQSRSGADTLFLPTKKLLGIQSIVEDGVTLLPESSTYTGDFKWSEDGIVVKTNHQPWTPNFQGLTVTFTHGYTEDEAADWRAIVLSMADRISLVRGLVGPFNTAVGPYRLSAYYGTSRTGNLPQSANWLDDLLSQFNTSAYVRIDSI